MCFTTVMVCMECSWFGSVENWAGATWHCVRLTHSYTVVLSHECEVHSHMSYDCEVPSHLSYHCEVTDSMVEQ